MSTITFTYSIPSITINEGQLLLINEAIAKAENKARANTIGSFNFEELLNTIELTTKDSIKTPEDAKKRVKKVYLSPRLYSKSKQFSTTATELVLEFYKNGKLKSYKATRASFPNYRVYSQSDFCKTIFY